MVTVTVNGTERDVDADGDMPLLWALRDELGLTGTKYGCGIGACGACTVHLDGQPTRACLTPLSAAAGRAVTTIEGLGAGGLTALQQAWLDENVPQCGYCQAGMAGNLCRCGTYPRIRKAIRTAAGRMNNDHA